MGAKLNEARALAASVRLRQRRAPAPRSLPFHGFDHPAGGRPDALRGILEGELFRHYGRVLVVDGSIGGVARWLVREEGCRAVVLAPDLDAAAAGRHLTIEAGMEDAVEHAAGEGSRLPFGSERFTHVWWADAADQPTAGLFAESFRCLRPTGRLAVLSRGRSATDVRLAFEAAGFRVVSAAALDPKPSTPSAVAELIAAELRRPPESAATALVRVVGKKPA